MVEEEGNGHNFLGREGRGSNEDVVMIGVRMAGKAGFGTARRNLKPVL